MPALWSQSVAWIYVHVGWNNHARHNFFRVILLKAEQFRNLYKIAIWHLKIWQKCYFGQSRIEVLQIVLVIFVSVSLIYQIWETEWTLLIYMKGLICYIVYLIFMISLSVTKLILLHTCIICPCMLCSTILQLTS